MRLLTLAYFTFFSVVSPAMAQDALPTDNDLFAGYCLGVTRAQEAWATSAGISDESDAFRKLETQRTRFLAYLMAENAVSMVGVMMAYQQGQQDSNSTLNALNGACALPAPLDPKIAMSHSRAWVQDYIAAGIAKSNACLNDVPGYQTMTRCFLDNPLPF